MFAGETLRVLHAPAAFERLLGVSVLYLALAE